MAASHSPQVALPDKQGQGLVQRQLGGNDLVQSFVLNLGVAFRRTEERGSCTQLASRLHTYIHPSAIKLEYIDHDRRTEKYTRKQAQ
jgi:hypothetical protein